MLIPILIALVAMALSYLVYKKFTVFNGDGNVPKPVEASLKIDDTQPGSIRTTESNYATADNARSIITDRDTSSRDVKTAQLATIEEYKQAKRSVDTEPAVPPVVRTRSELLRFQLADLPDDTAKNQSPLNQSSRDAKHDLAISSAIIKTTSKKETKKEVKKNKRKSSSNSK